MRSILLKVYFTKKKNQNTTKTCILTETFISIGISIQQKNYLNYNSLLKEK